MNKGGAFNVFNIQLLIAVFLIVIGSQSVNAESKIALVVGNGNYSSSPLSDPPNDAQLIVDTLLKLGFEVRGYKNLNQQEMRSYIRDFGKRLKTQKDSVGVFYYSGHGMQVEGENYMIPVGVSIEDEDDVIINGVGIKEVLTRMRVAGNSMNFVILDACRNNPFEKSFKSAANGLGRMDSPKGTLIAFAAQPNKVARQGPGKYSYFTEELAKHIVMPDISARDMLLNVRIAVHEKTNRQQLPVVEDQLLSKFYFQSSNGRSDLKDAWSYSFDGFQLGSNYYKDVSIRKPYMEPCDDDPIDEKWRAMVYGSLQCRGGSFPEGTSAMFFLPYKGSDSQSILAFSWLGGNYFSRRSEFPLRVGQSLDDAEKVLGKPMGKFAIPDSRLMVHEYQGKIYSVSLRNKLVGFVFGAVSSNPNSEVWEVVLIMYVKYTRGR